MIRGSDIIAAASQKELDNFAEYFSQRDAPTKKGLRDGADADHWGAIAAVFEDDGTLSGFARVKDEWKSCPS